METKDDTNVGLGTPKYIQVATSSIPRAGQGKKNCLTHKRIFIAPKKKVPF
jgi:hypothetical protein